MAKATLGERLKKLREEKDLSQDAIGHFLILTKFFFLL